MRRGHRTQWGWLLAGLLLAPLACIELDGQRIAWFHDEAKDELAILIHYDGIHDSRRGQPSSWLSPAAAGADQIPAFVESGDVMLLDWPGSISRESAREKLDDPETPAHERIAAERVLGLETEILGWYREPDGRVGAVQLVRIPQVSGFLADLNRAINMAVAAGAADVDDARMQARMRRAAAEDHAWVSLDGHALRITVPVDRAAWARSKGSAARELLGDLAERFEIGMEPAERDTLLALVARNAAGGPVSLLDEGDRITVILGLVEEPALFRCAVRRAYEPSMERVVMETVGRNVDAELRRTLLDANTTGPPAVEALLRWGPPEEQVRALVSVLRAGPDEAAEVERVAARGRLERMAEAWNRDRGLPPAPATASSDEAAVSAWTAWYEAVRNFPLSDL